MKILSVCPTLPYPPVDGGRRNVFFTLKTLAERGHEVHLACLTADHQPAARDALARHFDVQVVVHPGKNPSLPGALKSLMQTEPYILKRNHSDALLRVVTGMAQGMDVVQIEGIHAAWYGLALKERLGIPAVLRLHNLESSNLRSYLELQTNPLVRIFLGHELRKLVSYERSVSGRFDRAVLVCDDDEQELRTIAPDARTAVIPVGVDLQHFSPGPDPGDPDSVLWLGSLRWPPNRDSVSWFMREILPSLVTRMPGVRVRIAGSGSEGLAPALRHPNVEFLGEVEDIRPVVANSRVCIVPLRAGSGLRMKILEFFAMGKAVVSTTLGARGLGAVHGQHLQCADDAGAFSSRIAEVLTNRKISESLGQAGRRLVEERYSWRHVADGFERLYEGVRSS